MKQSKTGDLNFTLMADGFHAKLINAYTFLDVYGESHTVPAGFETDWASIPRFFWRIIPPLGPWSFASVAHDYLCLLPEYSRLMANRTMLVIMWKDGVHWFPRSLIYAAITAYAFVKGLK